MADQKKQLTEEQLKFLNLLSDNRNNQSGINSQPT